MYGNNVHYIAYFKNLFVALTIIICMCSAIPHTQTLIACDKQNALRSTAALRATKHRKYDARVVNTGAYTNARRVYFYHNLCQDLLDGSMRRRRRQRRRTQSVSHSLARRQTQTQTQTHKPTQNTYNTYSRRRGWYSQYALH